MYYCNCCQDWAHEKFMMITSKDADLYWRVTLKNKDGQTNLIKVKTDVPVLCDTFSKNYHSWGELEREVEAFFEENTYDYSSKLLRIINNINNLNRPKEDFDKSDIVEASFTAKCKAEIRCGACSEYITYDDTDYEFEGELDNLSMMERVHND